MKLKVGQALPLFKIEDVTGKKIESTQFPGKKLYLTFLRNTACPLCSFHVFRLLKMVDEFKRNNTEVVIFYESKKQAILSSPFFKEQVVGGKKLTVISDNERKIYTLFGTEINSEKATLSILEKNGRMPVIEAAAKAGFNTNGIQEGTHPDAIPADFLVDTNGVIQKVHYGADAGDNINLDEVEAFSRLV